MLWNSDLANLKLAQQKGISEVAQARPPLWTSTHRLPPQRSWCNDIVTSLVSSEEETRLALFELMDSNQ